MDPERLLKLPIRLFWSGVRHVDRIRAGQELRLLNVAIMGAAAAQGEKEGVAELRSALTEQMGTVMLVKEKVSSRREMMSFIEETIK